LLTADVWAGIVWTGMLTDRKSYTNTFPRLVPTIKAVPSGTKSIDVMGASASIFFIILTKFGYYVVAQELTQGARIDLLFFWTIIENDIFV
jgi:hypothetical protein